MKGSGIFDLTSSTGPVPTSYTYNICHSCSHTYFVRGQATWVDYQNWASEPISPFTFAITAPFSQPNTSPFQPPYPRPSGTESALPSPVLLQKAKGVGVLPCREEGFAPQPWAGRTSCRDGGTTEARVLTLHCMKNQSRRRTGNRYGVR